MKWLDEMIQASFDVGNAAALGDEGLPGMMEQAEESNQKVIEMVEAFEEKWKVIASLARKAVEAGGWCPLCEVTIGNGDVEHCDDCLLHEEVRSSSPPPVPEP